MPHTTHTCTPLPVRQWCIESQSPGGGAKLDIGALDSAVLAIKLVSGGGTPATKTAALRVNPPVGLDGVKAIRYQGAVPVSKLTVLDDGFAADMSVYAHGAVTAYFFGGRFSRVSTALHNVCAC